MITAEVIPISNKRDEAAEALKRVGFKVLSIGESITITGEQILFERIFKIKLLKLTKDVLPGYPKPTEKEFYRPKTTPTVPDQFKSLIEDVVFPEPPQYFR